jgi:hypothetical protein
MTRWKIVRMDRRMQARREEEKKREREKESVIGGLGREVATICQIESE